MASQLELRVRQLDDETKKPTESAREVAGSLNIPLPTAKRYIQLKRHGFKSTTEYTEYLARQKGFASGREYRRHLVQQRINPETEHPFKSLCEYNNYLARKRGFKFYSDYEAALHGFKSVGELNDFNARKRGYKSMAHYVVVRKILRERLPTLESFGVKVLPFIPQSMPREDRGDSQIRENEALVSSLLSSSGLTKRQQDIIIKYFLQERTLKEISKETTRIGSNRRITSQGVHEILKSTLKKLRSHARNTTTKLL